MALVGSDFHGDEDRLDEFLSYRPEEKHIVVGDIFDGAPPENIIRCFDMVLHANARHPELVDMVWGNHEVGYMYMSPFECSGMQPHAGFGSKLDRCKHRFGVALVEDNFLITHAGVHPRLAKFEDINEQCAWLNKQWEEFLNFVPGPYTREYPKNPIFNVGSARDGHHAFGGIFWLDWTKESVSAQYNQIFGHTRCDQIYVMNHSGKTVVCVDSPRYDCFNTKTGKIEHYGHNR